MTLYFIAALTILLHLSFAGMRVLLSLFALHLHASPLMVGLLMSVLAAVPMVFAVTWGRYIDRVGTRTPMLLGAAAVVSAGIVGYALPRIETLFLVSALAGAGFMLFHIAVNQAAGLLGGPEHRAHNFTVLALAFSTSNFIGPVLTGYAIEGIGHRASFLLLACTSVITLAVLLWNRIELPRNATPFKGSEKQRVADLFRIPRLFTVFIVSGLLSMAWDLFTFVMPIHGSRLGLSASTIGLILGCFGSAVFAVRLVLPWIVHRVDEWKILVGAMFVTGAGLAVMPLTNDVPTLMILSFMLGVGLGGTQPMIMALLFNTAPQGRGGEAVGVRTLLLNFSQAGIPLVFGALGAALGMTPVFWTMAVALVAGGWYARRRGTS
ncbi:MAG TPA: MFS transporter [Burkholderiales bacterium]